MQGTIALRNWIVNKAHCVFFLTFVVPCGSLNRKKLAFLEQDKGCCKSLPSSEKEVILSFQVFCKQRTGSKSSKKNSGSDFKLNCSCPEKWSQSFQYVEKGHHPTKTGHPMSPFWGLPLPSFHLQRPFPPIRLMLARPSHCLQKAGSHLLAGTGKAKKPDLRLGWKLLVLLKTNDESKKQQLHFAVATKWNSSFQDCFGCELLT